MPPPVLIPAASPEGETRRRSCYTGGTEVLVVTQKPWRAKLENALRQAVDQIARHYKPERIYVFGSMARGDVHEDSDLDLLIIKETDQPFLARVNDVLSIVDVDVPIELLVYTPEELRRMKEEGRDFILTVLEEARLCYEAGQQHPRSTTLAPDR